MVVHIAGAGRTWVVCTYAESELLHDTWMEGRIMRGGGHGPGWRCIHERTRTWMEVHIMKEKMSLCRSKSPRHTFLYMKSVVKSCSKAGGGSEAGGGKEAGGDKRR
jgi:hypothetical protein